MVPPFAAGYPPADTIARLTIPGVDPSLTNDLPPEMLAMMASSFAASSTPRNNPWTVMIVGMVGLLLLFMAVIAITVFASNG